MGRNRLILIFFFTAIVVLASFGFPKIIWATTYETSGYVISTNLLSGVSPEPTSIDSFIYNLSAKPANTEASVQFSQDNTNWYDSSETLNASNTLSTGVDNTIDLSGLGWSGANFYYKVTFSSDGTSTPVLDDITLEYTSNVAPSVAGVSLNNGDNITLDANSTVAVSATGTVSDNNGYADITSVQGRLYRSGVGSG